jgi:hypothetical protein
MKIRKSRIAFLQLVSNATTLILISVLSLGQSLVAPTQEHTVSARKPLFRDPIHDGAADPSLVWNRSAKKKKWMMFYTNRRADLHGVDKKDVAWVHGTRIGVAESKDGNSWTYAGVASIPYGKRLHILGSGCDLGLECLSHVCHCRSWDLA